MEAHYRKVRDLLLKPSGKGRPPKIPVYYDIYDRIFGNRTNAIPPALAGSLPGANIIRTPPTTPGITDQGPTTEGLGLGSPHPAIVAPSSPSPTSEPTAQPSPPATTPSRHMSPNAAGASPPLSRGVGACAGLSLRGNWVIRWPRAAAADNDANGTEAGMPSIGGGMPARTRLCDEIASRIAGTMRDFMRDNIQEFMVLTQELVQSDQDAQGAKGRRDTPPDESGGGSAVSSGRVVRRGCRRTLLPPSIASARLLHSRARPEYQVDVVHRDASGDVAWSPVNVVLESTVEQSPLPLQAAVDLLDDHARA
ncbi:unnamed protein product [Closterium sp. Naga37s-1]|nr:unnamed protein product [Closterium sp. Naga37s-1]CAI5517580.1 unnamed protein product [Closterium sp. Naga37s-1]CAI5527099.1 unnamed protein product [Closterium sp. Naga37s-1]